MSPDRVELTLSVETRAATGAAAGRENAVIIAAVLDTLRRGFRLTNRDLSTTGYTLRPELSYPRDGGPPKVEGYVAVNMIRVRSSDLASVGTLIDAALVKRATNIAALTFSSSTIEASRRQALALAVENSRRDAEVMARAAGGRLGELIELTSQTTDGSRQPPIPTMLEARMAMDAGPTQIQAGDQRISAQVLARWRFVPGDR